MLNDPAIDKDAGLPRHLVTYCLFVLLLNLSFALHVSTGSLLSYLTLLFTPAVPLINAGLETFS